MICRACGRGGQEERLCAGCSRDARQVDALRAIDAVIRQWWLPPPGDAEMDEAGSASTLTGLLMEQNEEERCE